MPPARRPLISAACAPATIAAEVTRENGAAQTISIVAEYPLTLYVDGRERITLMTLGQMPEALALGWLLSQRFITDITEIEEVRVDWEVNAAAVYTRNGLASPQDERLVVTSGCGQGTMFSHLMEEIETLSFDRNPPFGAAALASLLEQVRRRETIYKQAGAVHACALAEHGDAGDASNSDDSDNNDDNAARLLCFVEDIGRHNAADSISGWMRLNNVSGGGKVFYTTGRLTSEMVVKCAQMGIPYLVSRSGTTAMGYRLANKLGLTMIGRALNTRYVVFSGADHFIA